MLSVREQLHRDLISSLQFQILSLDGSAFLEIELLDVLPIDEPSTLVSDTSAR